MSPDDSSPMDAALADSAWLRRLARSLAGDEQRAEDALQETFVAALSQRSPVRAPRAWLAAVLRNVLRQESRRRERRERREKRPGASAEAVARGAPPADEVVARLELQQAVLEAVRELDEPYRATLVRRYFDGLAPRAIAAEHGIAVKTVRTRLERGLARLRQGLDRRFKDRSTWAVALLRLARVDSAAATIGVGTLTPWIAASALAATAALGLWSALPKVESGAAIVTDDEWPEPEPSATTPLAAGSGRSPAAAESPGRRAASPEAPAPVETRGDAPVATSTLVVRVTERGTGAPVAGARVRAEGTEPPVLRVQAAADRSGVARLDVLAGQRLRVAASPGDTTEDPRDPVGSGASAVAALAEGEVHAVTIELPRGLDARAVGRVVDAASGRPLAGASVRPTWDTAVPPALERRTDADGSFELAFPSWRASYAAVELPGWGPAWLALGDALSAGESTPQALEVRLERAAALDLTLLRPDGTPLERVRARLAVSPAEILQPIGATVRARDLEWNADVERGHARITGLPAGARIFAALYGPNGELLWRPPAPIELDPGEERRAVWTLGGGTRVHGVVRDDEGRPIADCEVWALAFDHTREGDRDYRWLAPGDRGRVTALARSDDEGRYALAGLSDGTWWIGPGRFGSDDEQDLAPLAQRRALASDSPGAVVEFDWVAHRGLAIEGRVLGLPTPPPHVAVDPPMVIARSAEIEGSLQSPVGRDGSFHLGPLGLDVPYALHVQMPRAVSLGSDPVIARPGDRAVELDAGGGATITGRVVDAQGDAVAASVHLRLPGSGSLGIGAGGDGTFHFPYLQPGEHVVRATTADGRVALLPVPLQADTQEDVELRLERGARLVLALEGSPDPLRCEILHAGVVIADFTLRRGHPATETVPPGPVLVQVYSQRDGARTVHAARPLDAMAGQTYELALDVP